MLNADHHHCDHSDTVAQGYRNCYGEPIFRCRGCGTLLRPGGLPKAERAKHASELAEEPQR